MYRSAVFTRILVLGLALFVSACSSDGEERPEYLDSRSLSSLEIPPQLTAPDGSELQLPKPSDKALQAYQQREGMEGKVAPRFNNMALKSDQGLYWLEIEQGADQLWSTLHDFWAHEGIELARDEPMLGLMETEWLKEYQIRRDLSFLKRVFNMLSADFMDRFRLRVERVNPKLSRVYISHRGLEKVLVDDAGTRWQSRPNDPDLEKEMYYRLALFGGMSQLQADDMFAAYVPYQSRIRVLNASEGQYELSGQPAFVWQRVLRAVDRLGAEILEQNAADKRLQLKVIGEKLPQLEQEEDPEATGESGWIWTETPEKRPVEEDRVMGDETELQVMISLTAGNGKTLMQVRAPDGSMLTSELGVQFKSGLANLLR